MAIDTSPLRRLQRPSPGRRFPLWVRLTLVPVVAAITIVGLWVFAGVVTNDFALSMVLTAVWFGGAGLVALWLAWRWRALALPVLGTFVVTATAIGGYLAWSTFRDVTVNEQIAVGAPVSQVEGGSAGGSEAPASGNVQLASGGFVSQAHGTSGTAAVVRLEDGSRVLTFTSLDTDNGPDLRVYLVAGPVSEGGDPGDFVDLGGLKGNKGDQEYEIPDGVDLTRYTSVSIWCRAFSVSFGMAQLLAS